VILAQDGILNVTIVLDKSTRSVKAEPVIIAKGFMYEKESDDIIKKVRMMINEDMDKYSKSSMNVNELQNLIKKRLRTYLYQETKRNPVVLPIILEI
ncbi:MAG: ribonuclease J, partial [Clostridia bacterium]